ncbi:unnamed protein product, partial [Polarella glacialis]
RCVTTFLAAFVATCCHLGCRRSGHLEALNRFLVEQHELQPAGNGGHRAVIPLSDRRATHVARVLQLRDGDALSSPTVMFY